MKKTDLEKNKGLKVSGQMKQRGTPGRFAQGSAAIPDRRERRKLDQSLGLVPFAIKLNGELVKQIQALAQDRKTGLNEVVAELLQAALNASRKAKT